MIKNRVRALWGSPLSYEMVASVADPYYLHIHMRVVFRRGFLGRVFFVFFALSHFCDLASLWCLLHPRPLESCLLQWFVQVHVRRASVTVRHYGAFCTEVSRALRFTVDREGRYWEGFNDPFAQAAAVYS